MTNWQPSASDKLWLWNLFQMLKVKGVWVAPLGFTFVKKNQTTLEIVDFNRNDPNVIETIERVKKIGPMIGITVELGT